MLNSTLTSKATVWGVILIASSILFSFSLACATLFVALGVVAAFTLPRNIAMSVMLTAWASNQLIGFAFQHYPVDTTTLIWSGVLAITAIACVEAARFAALKTQGQAAMQAIAAFMASFAVYEVLLIAGSLVLGGIENFTLPIQADIFALNILASVVFAIIAVLVNGLGIYKIRNTFAA